jgi:hypothetical protein
MKSFEVNIKHQMIGGHAYAKFVAHSVTSKFKLKNLNDRFKPEIQKFDQPKTMVIPSFSEIEKDNFLSFLEWDSSFPGFSCPELTKYVEEFIEDKECAFYKDGSVNSVCLGEFHGLIIHGNDVLEIFYQYCD